MTIGPAHEGRHTAVPSWSEWVLRGLALAAATELVVLRIATRTAIHVPGVQQFTGPYSVLAGTGRFAFRVAVLLLVATLPVTALFLVRRGRAGTVAATGVVMFLIAAGAALAGIDPLAVGLVSLVAAVLAAVGATADRPTAARVVIGFLVAAVLAFGLPTHVQLAGQGGLGTLSFRPLLALGELLGLAFLVTTPLLVPAQDRRFRGLPEILLTAGVAAVVLAAVLGNPATAKVLLLWNFGLAGYYPAVLYAAGTGALTFTLLRLLRTGDSSAALGLVLLVCGAVGLHSTYQSGLVLAGLAVLGLSPPPPPLPELVAEDARGGALCASGSEGNGEGESREEPAELLLQRCGRP